MDQLVGVANREGAETPLVDELCNIIAHKGVSLATCYFFSFYLSMIIYADPAKMANR